MIIENIDKNWAYHYTIYVYTISGNHLLWKRSVADKVTNVTESGDNVYISVATSLIALSLRDGYQVWQHSDNDQHVFSSVFILDGTLFVHAFPVGGRSQFCFFNCEPPASIEALNLLNGSIYWRHAMDNYYGNASQLVAVLHP